MEDGEKPDSQEEFTAFMAACKSNNILDFELFDLFPTPGRSGAETYRRRVAMAKRIDRSTTEINRFLQYYQTKLHQKKPKHLPVSRAQSTVVSSGDPLIDKLLKGGFHSKSVTEVFGESRTGKSTFMLQLGLAAQSMPGNEDKYVVHIDTESGISSLRQEQISARFKANFDKIFIKTSSSALNLEELLQTELEKFLGDKQVCMLIIDSVAILTQGQSKDPALHIPLQDIGRQLHRLAWRYDMPVVVVNQLRSRPAVKMHYDEENDLRYMENQERWFSGWRRQRLFWSRTDMTRKEQEQAHRSYAPALGYGWTNCIDTRIALKIKGEERTMEVVFSPWAPPRIIRIEVVDEGIKGVVTKK